MDSCHLAGCSLGAGLALEVALTRPGLVRSLLLAPPGGSLLTERGPALAAFAAAETAALGRGDLDAAVEANVDAWVVERVGLSMVEPAVAASVRVMQRRVFQIDTSWAEPDLEWVELDPPAVQRYAEVLAPVLLVVGGRDLEPVHRAADRLQWHVPRARRVDRAHTGHLPSMEEPEHFLRLLLDWVAARD